MNAKDESGDTPLHLASLYGHEEVAGLLVEAGADPNIKNNIGKSPLDLAVESGVQEAIDSLKSRK